MGINLGSIGAIIICGWLGETYGWRYGFGAAGIGMIFGLLTFLWGQKFLKHVANPPNAIQLKNKVLGLISTEHLIYIASIAAITFIWILMQYHTIVGYLLTAFIGMVLLFLTWYMAVKTDKVIGGRIFVLIILNIAVITSYSIHYTKLYEWNIDGNNLCSWLVNKLNYF